MQCQCVNPYKCFSNCQDKVFNYHIDNKTYSIPLYIIETVDFFNMNVSLTESEFNYIFKEI